MTITTPEPAPSVGITQYGRWLVDWSQGYRWTSKDGLWFQLYARREYLLRGRSAQRLDREDPWHWSTDPQREIPNLAEENHQLASEMAERQRLIEERPARQSERERQFLDRVIQAAIANRELSGVYFIRCGEFIKIGYAKNLALRVKELQVGNPHYLCPLFSYPARRLWKIAFILCFVSITRPSARTRGVLHERNGLTMKASSAAFLTTLETQG